MINLPPIRENESQLSLLPQIRDIESQLSIRKEKRHKVAIKPNDEFVKNIDQFSPTKKNIELGYKKRASPYASSVLESVNRRKANDKVEMSEKSPKIMLPN